MNSTKPGRGAEIPVAEAVGWKELVSYQSGSVVSRVLLSRETGNVTLFAFDEGQGLSEHTAPFDALVQVLEGEVEISIDRKPLPAHRPHALKAITKFKMLLTMIRAQGTR